MTIECLRAELRHLLERGRVGEFDHLELIEVIGTPPKEGTPYNVLTVAVLAENRPEIGDIQQLPLIPLTSKLDGFKGWRFGLVRTYRTVTALDAALATFAATGRWELSGEPLNVGALHVEAATFVPPDGTARVPLNGILKNNFWAGSHVFRLADREKAPFAPFFADRRRLQALSDAVSVVVPLRFAGLADLLGDVLIQIPVTIMVPRVTTPRSTAHSDITVSWRRGTPPRALTVAARTRWEEMLTAAVSEPFQDHVRLPISNHHHPLETEILETGTGMLLGATASTSIIKQIDTGMHLMQPEPRMFTEPDSAGQPVPARVRLTATTHIVVGEEAGQNAEYWHGRRQDLEERRRLGETRDFVQYRPRPGSQDEPAQALADLRFLIDRHGEDGADLWDPYLDAVDLLRTLFWCRHSGAPLRALTDGREVPSTSLDLSAFLRPVSPPRSFADEQRVALARYKGNGEGLRLEYRMRHGPKGWGFHDRFLIFPNRRAGPLAWSLGTSVNSLGRAHHILQRVLNPAMVAGAFQDLWTALDEPQHVIWRSW